MAIVYLIDKSFRKDALARPLRLKLYYLIGYIKC